MISQKYSIFSVGLATAGLTFVVGCGSGSNAGSPGAAGQSATGGQQSAAGSSNGAGGSAPSGGASGSIGAGGSISTGGSSASGGSVAAAGSQATGGSGAAAGSQATGGAGATGGAPGGSGGTAGSAAGSAGSAGSGGAATGGPQYPYVFSVFNDAAASSDLIIYTSTDALNFTLLYDTKYTGPSGFLRDPSIMRHTDRKFYVAFTTPPTMACCGAESSFSIASSSNLKDWSDVATVPAGVPGVKNTWAPEWFKDKDGSVYVLVNVDGKTYRYKAMNDALTQFSAPTFINIGPGFIDTFMVLVGTTYHVFTKLESATLIQHGTSTSMDGPWDFTGGTGDWAGWGNHKEAPAVIDLGNGTWRFYCDAGSAGHEMYSDSTDQFAHWTAPKTLPVVGNNISHGTVIKGN